MTERLASRHVCSADLDDSTAITGQKEFAMSDCTSSYAYIVRRSGVTQAAQRRVYR